MLYIDCKLLKNGISLDKIEILAISEDQLDLVNFLVDCF